MEQKPILNNHSIDEKPLTVIDLPTMEEILLVNALNMSYPDHRIWNGARWKELFETLIVPASQKLHVNEWDMLAVLIMKMHGAEFIKKEDGSCTLKLP